VSGAKAMTTTVMKAIAAIVTIARPRSWTSASSACR